MKHEILRRNLPESPSICVLSCTYLRYERFQPHLIWWLSGVLVGIGVHMRVTILCGGVLLG